MTDSIVKIESSRRFTLPRSCEVTIVPAGHRITLPEGEKVKILQALGGTATVTTADGEMARLSPADSIEFGLIEAPTAPTTGDGSPGDFDVQHVWDAATTVYDPEIPVDIVNLGLVYDCNVEDEDGRTVVGIKMTLTAPGCGMGPVIAEDARNRVLGVPGINQARVDIVWDPPWTQTMISEDGKMQLGLI